MKQQDRTHNQLDESLVLDLRLSAEVRPLGAGDCLTYAVRSALTDPALTAQSAAVSKANFGQLLTDTANGMRTGAALEDAVAERSVEVLYWHGSASGSGRRTDRANLDCRDSQAQLSNLDRPLRQGRDNRVAS